MRFIHGLFFLLYGLVSILNHYFLRSAGLDYGVANQALYLYAHAKPPMVTMLLGDQLVYHYMGLHVGIWVPLLSPFYWIFGSYTLLIFQNLFLIFGGIGLAKVAKHFKYTGLEQGLILVHYYVFFGIFSALASDYHDNVIAACFLPWLVLGQLKSNKLLSWIAFFAILLSKENLAIWLVFVSVALWFLEAKKTKVQRWQPLLMILVSTFWFFLCSQIIMPHYSNLGRFEQLNRYSHLGKGLPEILVYILQHPLKMLSLFFQSHVRPDGDEQIKQEFLWAMLFSGAWLMLLRPAFLLMALPLLMQKLWNKETAFWGVNYHYQVEFAALLALAAIFVLKSVSNRQRIWILGFVAVCALVQTVTLMQHRLAWFDPNKENIFYLKRYVASAETREVRTYLNTFDENESVCAQANFLPHLANRKELYHFPYTANVNVLIMSKTNPSYYPCSAERGAFIVDSLQASPYWEVIPNKTELVVLRRK